MGDHVNRLRRVSDRRAGNNHSGMQPLVDGADEVRLDLCTKVLGVGSRKVVLVGLHVLPDCHDYKLVLRGNALEDFEALIALILAACLRKLPEETSSRRGRARRDLDVTYGI